MKSVFLWLGALYIVVVVGLGVLLLLLYLVRVVCGAAWDRALAAFDRIVLRWYAGPVETDERFAGHVHAVPCKCGHGHTDPECVMLTRARTRFEKVRLDKEAVQQRLQRLHEKQSRIIH